MKHSINAGLMTRFDSAFGVRWELVAFSTRHECNWLTRGYTWYTGMNGKPDYSRTK